MAVLTWIAIILIILLILIIGILVIPFQISMQLYREGNINQGYLKVKWFKIRIINRKIGTSSPKKKKKEKEKKGSKIDFKRIPKIITLAERSLPYITNIFKAFIKSTKIKEIYLYSIFGLDDFVETVKISGLIWSVAPLINLLPNTQFSVEPDFHGERLDGSYILKLKMKLYPLVSAFLRALTKKPFRSLLSELRKVRS